MSVRKANKQKFQEQGVFCVTSIGDNSYRVTNLCGPTRTSVLNGERYFMLLIDDYSRMTWVTSRTPHQNGVVQRKNKTIIEMARTMIKDANLADV